MKLKDFQPSQKELDAIEERKGWQGPLTNTPENQKMVKRGIEKAKNDKEWADYRTNAEVFDTYATKNAGNRDARRKQRLKLQKQEEEENQQGAQDVYDAEHPPKPYKESPEVKAARLAISKGAKDFFKNKKASPNADKQITGYKSGGAVRGHGKARGGKACKIC